MPDVHSSAADRLPPPAGLDVRPGELGPDDRLAPGRLLGDGRRLVAALVRQQPVGYALAVLGAVVFVAGVLATALLIGDLTDRLLIPVLDEGEPVRGRLGPVVLLLLGAGVWRAAGVTLRRGAAGWLTFAVKASLRRQLVAHQLDLSLAWYSRQRVGDLLAVNEGHVSQATGLLGPLPYATGAVLLAVVAVVGTVAVDPLLGAALGIAVLVVLAVELLAAWAAFRAFAVEQHRLGVVARVAHESIDGAQTVRALGAREREADRFAAVVARLRDAQLVVQRRFSWLRAAIEALPSALSVPVVVVGAVRVGDGLLTAGDVVTVAYLLTLLAWPLALVGFLVWDTAHSLSGWRRVRRVLDVDERLAYGTDDRSRGGAADVDVRDVAFAYGDGTDVLEDVGLDVAAGATVAVVGPTASGKSTLLLLLARLWDPATGRIELDGRDVRGLARDALGDQVVLVGQDAFLFADSVRGNVALGRDVNDDAVWEALALAGVDDVVHGLPQGLDTVLGERGASLSGGQRQRVALARALVRRPRLLLLDDATSAVDPSVERRVLRGLAAAALPSTVVMVATRPASIALCDHVVLLDEGRVVATGTHPQLLADEPRYAALLRAYEQDRDERSAADRGRR